ncbi:DUF5132 domain-containing protein [Nostoc sp. MBR 210]|nr:DUF5132 domain-containing protein [Nostoc sp. MBR 210]
MESNFDWEKVNLPEIFEGLSAIIFSPMIVPVAEVIKQPLVQTAIKEGINLSQSYQEAVTVITDNVQTRQTDQNYRNQSISQPYLTDNQSAIAKDLLNIMSDFNADVDKMTNGTADLRVIVPLGLGLFALSQLIKQGFKFEDIPWYILAWFAFDSFIKLNDTEKSKSININKN